MPDNNGRVCSVKCAYNVSQEGAARNKSSYHSRRFSLCLQMCKCVPTILEQMRLLSFKVLQMFDLVSRDVVLSRYYRSRETIKDV